MYDPISASLHAVGVQSKYAFAFVFAAGAATSIGPCVAPRFLAAAGFAAGEEGATVRVGSMIAGLMAAYAAFGSLAPIAGHLVRFSGVTYAILALALAASGLNALFRAERHVHAGRSSVRNSCGAAFLLGMSFALTVSPCCTPLVFGILAYTSAAGSPLYGSVLLACFALGHALPLVALATGVRRVRLCLNGETRTAGAVVSGTLMLALSAYYAVIV